jgi:hypothetical protein
VSVLPAPEGGNQVEILIWQIDPRTNRRDLATPLNQSGTGVGQVLAILYVALSSDAPRTILIDEPGSFLHPGASRALIRILRRLKQHQYIISTHSPEVIAELGDARVTIVRWNESRSTVEQHLRTTGPVAAGALQEIGAKLSDVFGFDSVLWVEGPSDADSIKLLLELRGEPQRHLAILPVRDTGAFKRRSIAEVLHIYRNLAMGDALLPPAAVFVFDRDGRTDQEITDVSREAGGKLRFWDRRMLENYLLVPAAIAQLFNEAGADYSLTTTRDAVRQWVEQHGGAFMPDELAAAPFTPTWLQRIDAAKLLSNLFIDLSEARLEYRKAVHTPRLTAITHEIDRDALNEIVRTVEDVLDRPLPSTEPTRDSTGAT